MIAYDVETWKPCFNGYYEASSTGKIRRVKSWKRRFRNGKLKLCHPSGNSLRPVFDKRGYPRISICIEGYRLTRCIHQAVAEAFHGKIPKGLVTNHKDGNKRNNTPENLEYITQADNNRHGFQNGLIKAPVVGHGEDNPTHILTNKSVRAIRRARARREKVKDLAIEYGVAHQTISACCSGQSWRHIK